MTESKSVALPLGYTPLLQGKKISRDKNSYLAFKKWGGISDSNR